MVKSINKYLILILLIATTNICVKGMEIRKEQSSHESLQEMLPSEVLSIILEYVMHQAYHESATNLDFDKALKDLYVLSHLIYDLTHTNPIREIALKLLVNKTMQMEKWVKMSQSIDKELAAPWIKINKKIEKGNIKKVKKLLLCGIDVNEPDIYGNIPLVTASECDNKKMLKLLLEAGADVNKKNSRQDTALHKALFLKDKAMVRMLLQANADVDIKDGRGCTPLMLTSKPSIIKMILDKKPNLNKQDMLGYTALMSAICCKCKRIIQLLLDAGARTDLKNKQGKTALTIAIENHDYDIAQLIIEAANEQ